MPELLLSVLAVTSPQSKHVPFSVLSVEGQEQDVGPAEKEQDICLKGVGLFGA